MILNRRSFASIATLLNHYILGIASVGGEERVAPYRIMMAQLQNYADILLKIQSANKSKMVEATFKRFLEE